MALLGPISDEMDDGWVYTTLLGAHALVLMYVYQDWSHGFPSGDWARYTAYIQRIRSLSYHAVPYDGHSISGERLNYHVPAKLLYYTAANHGQYLLPRVRRIRWFCDDENQLQAVFHFISPTIEDIRLGSDVEVSPWVPDRLLRSLRAVLPHVRVLHFRAIPSDTICSSRSCEAVEALLESQDDLREIRLPYYPMVSAMFKHHLRVLEADLDCISGINLEDILSELADKCPHIEHLRIQFWGGQCFEFPDHPPAPSILEASELGPGALRDIRLGRRRYPGDGSGLAGIGSSPYSIQAFVRGLRQPCRRDIDRVTRRIR